MMEMFGGMFVFRRIAATDMTAREAHAEMDPLIAHLHAFFADMDCGFADFDLIEVRAFLRHKPSFGLEAIDSVKLPPLRMTKGHTHTNHSLLSRKIIAEVFSLCSHTCCGSIIYPAYSRSFPPF
jgi:hypothetical protein